MNFDFFLNYNIEQTVVEKGSPGQNSLTSICGK